MASTRSIIEEMQLVAPAGQRDVDFVAREQLRHLTELLIHTDQSASVEYQRFLAIRNRELDVSGVKNSLRAAYRGRRILVTGGTGCIGTALIRQLRLCNPSAIYSVSRGRRPAFDPQPGTVYLHADVSDVLSLQAVFAEARPDVVFHLAAQRSPWLAERAIKETVLTNVVGTQNVLGACRLYDVPRFVYASTGKAMRYYTTDIYAATKKIAEWLVHEYAAEGRVAGAGRFTHVVDNGVILAKIQEAMDDPQGLCRVHDPDIEFYVQSAIESAQLLMLAGLNDDDERQLSMVAIRCLGNPARLLSMTLGKLASASLPPPIYFSGYDKGYERGNPPGLYDPMTAVDLSPLINAVEAGSAQGFAGVPAVDRFTLSLPTTGVNALVDELQFLCGQRSLLRSCSDRRRYRSSEVRVSLARAGVVMADALFAECSESLFVRLSRMAQRADTSLPCSRKVKVNP